MIRTNQNGETEIALINIFASINGEGYAAGKPTVFIRTMGCNLRCSFCDTKECWNKTNFNKVYPDREDYMWLTAKQIFNKVEEMEKDYFHKSICLTGGEPLMLDNTEFMMNELLPLFVNAKYDIGIETDGAIDVSAYKQKFGNAKVINENGDREGITMICDYKLPSSKMNHLMINNNLYCCSEMDLVKMVISDDPEDWEILTNLVEYWDVKPTIYLSPCFGNVTMNKIPEFIMAHANKRIRAQLQIHKFFWDVNTKDV